MATVMADLALDMSATNMFAALGVALYASKGKIEAGVEPGRFYFFTPPNKDGIAANYTFSSISGETIGYEMTPIPGLKGKDGKTLKILLPSEGTLSSVLIWDYSPAKARAGKEAFELRASIYNAEIDIKKTIDALLKYNVLTQTSDFKKAVKGAYEGIFKDADALYGSKADDKLYGFDENDWLQGGAGKDLLNGGDGRDWASYASVTSKDGVTVNLSKSSDNKGQHADGDKYVGIENLEGSNFDDKLSGNKKDNVLNGRGGVDTLFGGGGEDAFAFSTEFRNGDKFDTIKDFSADDGDMIVFDKFVLNEWSSLTSKKSNGLIFFDPKGFAANSKGEARDLDDRVIYNTKTGDLFIDIDGSNTMHQAEKVAHLVGDPDDLKASMIKIADFELLA